MRPSIFAAERLRQRLLEGQIATLSELKRALGTDVDITVFRKLKELSYRTSYSHRGSYYTLEEIAQFNADGLWSFGDVWFSRKGTLLRTAEDFILRSARGYFADELRQKLHVEVKDALRHLVEQKRVARRKVAGRYLYIASDAAVRRRQILARRALEEVPTLGGDTAPDVVGDEVKAAIVLFYSLLDERQRRLYAGLESLKLGRGGDQQLAEFLDLDPHTVAKGRRELLAQDVITDRVRRVGGGRTSLEKKRRK
jgi:hypothetical protein